MSFTISPAGYLRTRGTGTPPVVAVIVLTLFQSQLETDIDSVFFAQNEFGKTVQYLHAGDTVWQTYKVIFDDPQASMNYSGPSDFNSLRPQVQLQESKLKQPIKAGDVIKMDGLEYQNETYISDGVGITTLYMHRRTI
jgi:hypothetical protein